MKEEWLFPAALIPVDRETTHALVAEIKRLIDVVGGMALAQPEQEPVEDVVAYHSDGTRTVRIAPKRPWVGLTDEETDAWFLGNTALKIESGRKIAKEIEAALRSKNT